MSGFSGDIESLTIKNRFFRSVIYTAPNMQLVLMSLKAGEEIGEEVHPEVDQFFRIEAGFGEAFVDGQRTAIGPGSALLVPAGSKHNVVNTGEAPLKLYTLYAPPNHRDGTVHVTKAEAEANEEPYDGKTTEGTMRTNLRKSYADRLADSIEADETLEMGDINEEATGEIETTRLLADNIAFLIEREIGARSVHVNAGFEVPEPDGAKTVDALVGTYEAIFRDGSEYYGNFVAGGLWRRWNAFGTKSSGGGSFSLIDLTIGDENLKYFG